MILRVILILLLCKISLQASFLSLLEKAYRESEELSIEWKNVIKASNDLQHSFVKFLPSVNMNGRVILSEVLIKSSSSIKNIIKAINKVSGKYSSFFSNPPDECFIGTPYLRIGCLMNYREIDENLDRILGKDNLISLYGNLNVMLQRLLGDERSRFFPLNTRITVSQNIFSGGQDYYDVQLKKSLIKEKYSDFRIKVEDFLKKAVKSYLKVIAIRDNIRISEKQIRSVKLLLKKTEIMFQNGICSKLNLEEVNLRLLKRENSLEKLRTELELASEEFFLIFKDKPATLESDFIKEFYFIFELKNEEFISGNNTLDSLSNQIVSKFYEKRRSTGVFFPSLSIFFDLNIHLDLYTLLKFSISRYTSSWDLGISFNWKILDGGVGVFSNLNNSLEIEKGILMFLQKKKEIIHRLGKIKREIRLLQAKEKLIQREIEIDEKNFVLAVSKFVKGNIDINAVLQAEGNLFDIRFKKVEWANDLVLKIIELVSIGGFFDIDKLRKAKYLRF